MRDSFISGLLEIARQDSNVILLTADLGFGVLDEYRNELPKQFINVGIAEQNMIGLATGLALEGNIVYCYSIANFPTLRCLEQIRNDAAYHDANVKIVSVGGGLSYGPLGMSHHATEDLAILRVIPGIEVLVPGTLTEAKDAAVYMQSTKGVQYLRLDKSHGKDLEVGGKTNFGQWPVIREGRDLCIIVTGGILEESLEAAETLLGFGVSARVVSAINLTPESDRVVLDAISNFKLLVSVEEHSISGGLGGLIAETLSGTKNDTRLIRLGIKKEHISAVGSQKYLRHLHGISAEKIVEEVLGAKLPI
jgi:transketolase